MTSIEYKELMAKLAFERVMCEAPETRRQYLKKLNDLLCEQQLQLQNEQEEK